jgi:hypothetical protein
MQYHPYMETCSKLLAERMEYPADEYLVFLVRGHRLIRNIQQSLPMEHLEATWSMNTPVLMLTKSFAAEMQGFVETIPDWKRKNCKWPH